MPKDDDWRPVLIVAELRPYLEEMLAASPSARERGEKRLRAKHMSGFGVD